MTTSMLRVAIIGPESCGKTTLVLELQNALTRCGHFAVCVEEYARAYYAQREYHPRLRDVLAIARGQLDAERQAARLEPEVLLCDSTALTCAIWAEVAFGTPARHFAAMNRPLDYDLTLLACPDIPWAPDPLRSHSHARDSLLLRYRQALEKAGVVAVEIRGVGAQRFCAAWAALAQKLPDLPKI